MVFFSGFLIMSTLITRRPQRGTAYGTTGSAQATWNEIVEPGGRKLWFKLIIGFTIVAFLGTLFIALGAALFPQSYKFYKEGNTSFPMVLCIVSLGK